MSVLRIIYSLFYQVKNRKEAAPQPKIGRSSISFNAFDHISILGYSVRLIIPNLLNLFMKFLE